MGLSLSDGGAGHGPSESAVFLLRDFLAVAVAELEPPEGPVV